MASEETHAAVQSSGGHDTSRPIQDAPPFPTSVPAQPVHEGGNLFGDVEENRSYEPQRNSAVAFVPRPSSGIQASPTSMEKHDMDSMNNSTQELYRNDANQGLGVSQPLPPLSTRFHEEPPAIRRQRTRDTRKSAMQDWIVPSVQEKPATLASRLQPTIEHATAERDKYALKAKWTGWILNAAIGLQVLLGSLTTGLSAVAASGSGKSAAVNTTILGALSTIVASYLARARGSNEPELSIARTKDLDQFIRDCEAFKLDHGHDTTGNFDEELIAKRRRFEELLGNANSERKLAPV